LPKNIRKTKEPIKGKTKPQQPKTIKGKFIGNEIGYGFVVQEGTETEDIFIPPPYTMGALHGDEVICQLLKPKEPPVIKKTARRTPKAQRQAPKPTNTNHRISGEIIEITHRKPLIGTYYTIGKEGYVQSMESKIPHTFTVSPRTRNRFGLADGHRIVFLVPKPKPKPKRVGEGKYLNTPQTSCQVTEVLGHIHDPGVDVLTLVRQYNIPHEFPEEVLAQGASLPEVITEEDLINRRDLRSELIFTIDGEDTKDIDDAISLTQTPNGHWQLGVHIADVSHYVQSGTPLDQEALNRGTSVYLADRVIPMLPHRLSSGICSLFPQVDRLTLSCIMTVDDNGYVQSYEITPSVINSKRRWTYQEVQEILDTGREPEAEPPATEGLGANNADNHTGNADSPVPSWQALFTSMNQLRETLYQKRRSKGALDFNLPEAKIRVDEAGRPISIEPYQRTHATGIIEEFMILCNETIAAHALTYNTPLIYRTHEAPKPEKLAQLKGIAQSFGFTLPYVSGPTVIQRLLETAEASPAYYSIAMAALTSLPQAYYTPDSPKHYGLASEAYCHFTSPIRRYADLQVHRIIKEMLTKNTGKMAENDGICPNASQTKVWQKYQNHSQQWDVTSPQDEHLHYISTQCSRTERVAEALEREVSQLKKVQFMKGREGQLFEGIVSGITDWGVFVMLANTTEGLVSKHSLKCNSYIYEKDKNRYTNKRANKSLTMGMPVVVRLLNADENERRLSFNVEINDMQLQR